MTLEAYLLKTNKKEINIEQFNSSCFVFKLFDVFKVIRNIFLLNIFHYFPQYMLQNKVNIYFEIIGFHCILVLILRAYVI